MSKPRFRTIETTADLGLLVWGQTYEELFENAALGLAHLIASPRGLSGAIERSIRVEGSDMPARLVAWLSEWVYLFDTEGFIGRSFSIDEFRGDFVRGRGRGDLYSPQRHHLKADVKGVTYHRLDLQRSGKRLRARLVLDV